LDILFRYRGPYLNASRWRPAMTRLVKKRFLLPVELMMILSINLVVIMLTYYAIMVWGLFRS
jgi:hypothetical protein